jgi:carboxymethylenebutenolidase
VNFLAVTMGGDLQAGVPFYGAAAETAGVARIKAPLLLHYAETDPRINEMWPAFEAALRAAGELSGGFAAPDGTPRGAVLVVHENRGLTDHIRAVAGRLAGDGYAALAPDLLSRVGGTAAVPDATAGLGGLGEADLVSDLQSGLTELGRRLPGVPQAAMGFCFGGGMVWRLLNGAPTELAAAVPFYGPAPADPTFSNSRAAVLGVFAELDNRVNAGRDTLEAALTARGLTHELVTVPGVDHAFFNDTGPRFNAAAAATTYQRVLDWVGRYLTP